MTLSIGANLRCTSFRVQGDRKHMEDEVTTSYQVSDDGKDLEYVFFGIFDGHGGPEAAIYVKNHLLDNIIKEKEFWSTNDDDVVKAIRTGYTTTHNEMRNDLENWPKTSNNLPSTSGTTASVAFIMRGKIYIGHVGDGRIVLGYQDEENGKWNAKQLTRDHKPESLEEKTRIEKCGGKVKSIHGVPRVVWKRPGICHRCSVQCLVEIPFLDKSRALGDFWSFNNEYNKFIVSHEPDVEIFNIDISAHRCLVFATNGLWNVLSADIAISNVYETEKNNNAMKALENQNFLCPSKNLVEKAIYEYSKHKIRADNTAVITVMLDPPNPPTLKSKNYNIICESIDNYKCINGDLKIQCYCCGYTILTGYTLASLPITPMTTQLKKKKKKLNHCDNNKNHNINELRRSGRISKTRKCSCCKC